MVSDDLDIPVFFFADQLDGIDAVNLCILISISNTSGFLMEIFASGLFRPPLPRAS